MTVIIVCCYIKKSKEVRTVEDFTNFEKITPVPFNLKIEYNGDPVCTIDLQGFKTNELVVVTPCKHVFHPSCLKEWLECERGGKKCPDCRFELDTYRIE